MMIRSAPPASAHLADSPVPAPAPMIGRPSAAWARKRASASRRFMRVPPFALYTEAGGKILVIWIRDRTLCPPHGPRGLTNHRLLEQGHRLLQTFPRGQQPVLVLDAQHMVVA